MRIERALWLRPGTFRQCDAFIYRCWSVVVIFLTFRQFISPLLDQLEFFFLRSNKSNNLTVSQCALSKLYENLEVILYLVKFGDCRWVPTSNLWINCCNSLCNFFIHLHSFCIPFLVQTKRRCTNPEHLIATSPNAYVAISCVHNWTHWSDRRS